MDKPNETFETMNMKVNGEGVPHKVNHSTASQLKIPPEPKQPYCKIQEYLKSYQGISQKTRQELVLLEARSNTDLLHLKQFFDKVRKEIDSKEQLLKMQYLNNVRVCI